MDHERCKAKHKHQQEMIPIGGIIWFRDQGKLNLGHEGPLKYIRLTCKKNIEGSYNRSSITKKTLLLTNTLTTS